MLPGKTIYKIYRYLSLLTLEIKKTYLNCGQQIFVLNGYKINISVGSYSISPLIYNSVGEV